MLASRLLILAAATLIASGCATVTRGTTQDWTVSSNPSGATVSLSNGERCATPCTFKLKRKFPFNVEICKPGYETVDANVVSTIKGAGAAGMAGNVLVGGLIGVGVDAGTGANKDLVPNPLSVELEAAEPGCVSPSFPAVPEDGQSAEDYAKSKR